MCGVRGKLVFKPLFFFHSETSLIVTQHKAGLKSTVYFSDCSELKTFWFCTLLSFTLWLVPEKQQTEVTVSPLEWLGSTDNRASLSALSVWVNMPTFTSGLLWILSLPPLSRQLFLVCLLFQFIVTTHTHTQAHRGEPTSVSGGKRWMGLACNREEEKTLQRMSLQEV